MLLSTLPMIRPSRQTGGKDWGARGSTAGRGVVARGHPRRTVECASIHVLPPVATRDSSPAGYEVPFCPSAAADFAIQSSAGEATKIEL